MNSLLTTLTCVALLGMVGCKKAEKPPPLSTHWVESDYHDGKMFKLVCDESSKIIANYRNPKLRPDEGWRVFGGNGAGYGDYVNADAARKKAEWITGQEFSDLNKCP